MVLFYELQLLFYDIWAYELRASSSRAIMVVNKGCFVSTAGALTCCSSFRCNAQTHVWAGTRGEEGEE